MNSELRDWVTSGPRRASVSSFGQGGTNAHVTLEEAPPSQPTPDSPQNRQPYWLCISGHTKEALERVARQLVDYLAKSPANLRDVAYTLRVGRRPLASRRIAACDSASSVTALLTNPATIGSPEPGAAAPAIRFFFPDCAASELSIPPHFRDRYPDFARAFDECQQFAPGGVSNVAFQAFCAQYAMARMWQAWGVEPASCRGEGAGELVAAAVSGAVPLAEAIQTALSGIKTGAGEAGYGASGIPAGEAGVSQ